MEKDVGSGHGAGWSAMPHWHTLCMLIWGLGTIVAAVALGLFLLGATVAAWDWVVLASGAVILLVALLLFAAASSFHRRDELRAALRLAFGLLAAATVYVTLSPGGTAFMAVLPVLIVALVLPFARFKVLVLILIGSFLVATAAVIANALWIPPARLPVTYDLAFRLVGYLALLTLTVVLFYRHHRYLATSIEHAQDESRALRRVRGRLEKRDMILRVAHRRLDESNRALTSARKRLDAESRSTMRFLNAAAHELRTPMTPVLMHLDLVRHNPVYGDDPALRRSLEVIGRNVNRLRHHVDDLVEVARMQAEQYTFRLQRTPLDALMREVRLTFADVAREKGVRFEVEEPDMAVIVDRDRIMQVFYNLVTNALDATPPTGSVAVTASKNDDMCLVRVRDTGKGFTALECQRAFEPFTGAGEAAAGAKTGLGLYISRSIVEGHGGRIGCMSPGPGKGSVFRFTIPLAPDAAHGAQQGPVRGDHPSHDSYPKSHGGSDAG